MLTLLLIAMPFATAFMPPPCQMLHAFAADVAFSYAIFAMLIDAAFSPRFDFLRYRYGASFHRYCMMLIIDDILMRRF